MTEHEWLTGIDGDGLARYWGDRFTERKARLLMLACCRRHAQHFVHAAVCEGITTLVDHYADPTGPDIPFEGEYVNELNARIERHANEQPSDVIRHVAFGVLVAIEPPWLTEQAGETLRNLVTSCLHDVARGPHYTATADEREVQAALVREVLGNPFRHVEVDPTWRTETVLALARRMYAAEEFRAMPILADALQDAGCDNDDILNHCRDGNQLHVRGCWVLDQLFGKE